MIQMWQKHQDWRQQDEADAAYLETEWRKANRAYKGRRVVPLFGRNQLVHLDIEAG